MSTSPQGVAETDRSSSSRGLLDLLPPLGYSNLLPGVLRSSLLPASSRPDSGHVRSSGSGSVTESAVLLADTADLSGSPETEQDQDSSDDTPSTSGRERSGNLSDGESPASAAERHRINSTSSVDLQVTL